MSTELIPRNEAEQIERVLVSGDLSQLKPAERVSYYKLVCDSVGLNPLTKPLEYITLNGKLTLYARKDCTDQLRKIHNVSVTIVAREMVDDCYVVTARATLPNGRTDESIGAVAVANLKGDAKANSLMKAETKAKRRVTLSICGLGMLDETEIETIPSAKPPEPPRTVEPRTFGKPQNSGSVDDTPNLVKEPSSNGADPGTVADPELVEELEQSIAYITAGQAANLHKQFRRAVEQYHPEKSLKADDKLYSWLKHRGYKDIHGNGSAGYIPAAGWFKVRDEALDYAKRLDLPDPDQ